MVDVSYEDYQDLVRKLSLANERVRDLQERVSGRDAHIAALEAQLAEALKALDDLAAGDAATGVEGLMHFAREAACRVREGSTHGGTHE